MLWRMHEPRVVTEDRRRRMSRESVIAVLREHGKVSRSELVRRTGLSRATVSSVVAELQAAGLVDDGAGPSGQLGGGRPAALVQLNRRAGTAIGIDFGKRHLRVALADLGHRVLAERAAELAADHDAQSGVELAARLVEGLLADTGIDRRDVVGVALGLPGPVTRASGELGSSTILPGWVGIPAAKAMTRRLGLDVTVENDANLGALAEWTSGAGRGCNTIAYVKVSTGIGAGLIVDGRPFRGAGGTAGELGHTVIDPHGPVCRCGNRGCLEAIVGAQALVDALRSSLGELSLAGMLERAAHGDGACRRVLADAGTAIGAAMATLCNLLNPERIVVGGDLAAAGDLLLEPARVALRRNAISSAAADVDVVPGVLGDRAEVLGAIALALRESGLGLAPAASAA
jgi:predicted NBD/HSP70 family sugar kinase